MKKYSDMRNPRRRYVIMVASLISVAMFLFVASAAWAANRWSDIADSTWVTNYGVTADEVATVAAGYPDHTFRPGLAVNRGQVAKMVVDGLDYATMNPAVPTFSDVPPTDYYYPWIEGGHDAGLIAGYPDGTYRPAASVIRVAANKMLGLALSDAELAATGHIQGDEGAYSSLALWYAADGAEILAGFADGNTIVTLEYKQTTAYLVSRGVVRGTVRGGQTYLDPQSLLTRAQAAVLIVRARAVVFEADVPAVTSLAPAAGASAGGNQVVITGTGFVGLSGAAAVRFGAANATSYVVDSPTKITAVAPPGGAGATVNVTVTTSAGTSAISANCKYAYGAPTVTLLAPPAGDASGNTTVVITGTGFAGVSGAAAVRFGSANANSYTVDSPTQITAHSPAGTAGTTVDVTVTTPAGTSALSANSKFAYGIPSVTLLAPAAGDASGNSTVVITGTGFVGVSGAAAVRFGTANAMSYVVDSPTQITAHSPAGVAGTTVDVTVTSVAGTSAVSANSKFYYGAPTVTLLSPAAGDASGNTTVVITGTGFVDLSGAAAVKFGTTNAASYTVDSPTQVTAHSPPRGAEPAVVDVTVTSPAGTSATSASSKYRYGPTITSVAPVAGKPAGGAVVVITGTGFVDVAATGAVKFGSTDATYTVDSPTQITATSPAGSIGFVDVTVTSAAGTSAGSANSRFYYGVPTVTGLSPTIGDASGNTTVVITGTGFVGVSGAAAVKFGTANATSYAVDSPTQITAHSPAEGADAVVDVTVETPAAISAASGDSKFTYGISVTSLSPGAGAPAGGTSVVITGTGFRDVTAVKFGGTDAASYTVNSPTRITAVSPPKGADLVVDVTVVASAGTSPTSAKSKYSFGAPNITLVAPSLGASSGGTGVTITGMGFTGLTGAAAVKFGSVNATSYTVDSPTQITATAPAGAAGTTVDVTVTTPGGVSTVGSAYTFLARPTVVSLAPATGVHEGGTSVVITGTGFVGIAATGGVKFGSVDATYTVNNATQITATSPLGFGGATVDVTVTSPGGVSATTAWHQVRLPSLGRRLVFAGRPRRQPGPPRLRGWSRRTCASRRVL